jgi:hypothetical protein
MTSVDMREKPREEPDERQVLNPRKDEHGCSWP